MPPASKDWKQKAQRGAYTISDETLFKMLETMPKNVGICMNNTCLTAHVLRSILQEHPTTKLADSVRVQLTCLHNWMCHAIC